MIGLVWTDVLSIACGLVVGYLLGQGLIKKRASRVAGLWVVGLVAGIAVLHGAVATSILAWLAGIARDLGLGLFAAGFAVRRAQAHPLILWVPGFLLLAAWLGYVTVATVGSWLGHSTLPATDAAHAGQQLLVELGPDDQISELQSLLARHSATAEPAYPGTTSDEDPDLAQTYLITDTDGGLSELLKDLVRDTENVDAAEENSLIRLEDPIAATQNSRRANPPAGIANDPLFADQWAFQLINGYEALQWLKRNTPRKKAKVAILDTGVDGRHEDLAGVLSGNSIGLTDVQGHGTHCAGLAGAATHNARGMASFNWQGQYIEIHSYKALGDDGRGSVQTVAAAIIAAAKSRVDVISLSLGSSGGLPREEKKAIDYALRKGCIVVAAAGNAGESALGYAPVSAPGVIAVAAVGPSAERATFSNWTEGLAQAVSAPGVDILSLKANGAYVRMSGTSMATPIVAGVLGVMRALNPRLTAKDACEILRSTGSAPRDGRIGPVVDAQRAFQAAKPRTGGFF